MRKKRSLVSGVGLLVMFILWTWMIRSIDVQPAGPDGSKVGFAALNVWFHQLTGVHMWIYTVTDWLGLVPILVCIGMGIVGAVQLFRRRSLLRVDSDILLLGLYYILVIGEYLFFEMVPVNYRPVLIDGILEASYPSSTTLLVLSVMPTLAFQIRRRCGSAVIRRTVSCLVMLFSALMVAGRTLSGVHWATDIIGAVLLSTGSFMLYLASVSRTDRKNQGANRKEINRNGIQ